MGVDHDRRQHQSRGGCHVAGLELGELAGGDTAEVDFTGGAFKLTRRSPEPELAGTS